MRAIDSIVIHCSHDPARAMVTDKTSARYGLPISSIEIDRRHRMEGRLSIGHHYVIRQDGVTEAGRPVARAGNHLRTPEGNRRSVSICLIGGSDENGAPADNFTASQYQALATLIDELSSQFPTASVVGHCALDERETCPSFDVADFIKETHDAPAYR